MNSSRIYEDISSRTSGDVYIGVVGPVRSGKSTFIKRFMEELVLPNIDSESERIRANDEMPQSASGKTVMTTEPKFIPEKAVGITLDEGACLNVKMIDCVGYVISGAEGLKEDGTDRMVMTPWSSSPLPFEVAAETGTKKVIDEHSTIGILVTSDGSFGDFKRSDYEESEERVIKDLKKTGKPFVIVVNSKYPDSDEGITVAMELEKKYDIPVALVNCLELNRSDIEHILELCLFEFPVTELKAEVPTWLNILPRESNIRGELESVLRNAAENITSVASIHDNIQKIGENEGIKSVNVIRTELGTGKSCVKIELDDSIFYKVISDRAGENITNQKELLKVLGELSDLKKSYDKVSDALKSVEEKGYGIVVPRVEDLSLEEPEIIKQSGGYGVKLKASADSIHMIKAKIKTEINPIVGSEKQSEEMVKYLLREFEENPIRLWESNMFGKSLHCLVNEGLTSKLDHMPEETRGKIAEALQKIVNEGSNGLICIIL
ncbi:MAG: stage IV sporulation protein A [Clostridia bacterium]|nr:stage IV sporulation protein A [Clostridia bacterium]